MTHLKSLTAAAALFAATGAYAQDNFITIGTGGQTGVYYVVGQSICRLVNRGTSDHGLQCTAPSTGGSVANINAIKAGDQTMGVAQSDQQYYAYNGESSFEEPFEGLRAVFSVHPEPFTVVARADAGIETFDDLAGKRVNIGNPGSGQRATMDVVMEAAGMTTDDFSLASELQATEQAQALCDNNIDAFVYQVGHPNGSIQEAFSSCDAVFVDVTGDYIDSLISDNPFYAEATIPASLYEGIEEDTTTFGVRATFVTAESVPEDTVYTVVQAVFDNFDRFKRLHPAFGNLDQEEMIQAGLSAPLHPGAEKYYQEQGWMDGGS
ncbi:TRAP transporter solute receptor TAXI family protein [Roseivivax marinus]|uniref:TRAP transporter solute receptor TAXI family protein n=1 Tax=Roseivivax marinus TaxID=1379903 RepID=W4HPB7_9RHOB|nr:TAXI family TRAP transporter solute-binding subunit [Roseivivax marinus]ETW13946.1 TRAP transporter solute receptor TAXI family protein [Roseivivax marinus]UMA63778.1 TAXI family TRAP transporter solute-binding subunit [Roseivivax marinus]